MAHQPHQTQQESKQLELLQKTLERCSTISLFKERFAAAGFDPSSVRSLSDLSRAPFVTKDDLRAQAPYGMLAVPLSELRGIHMSSGTAGRATLSAYTEHDLAAWRDCVSQAFAAAGTTANDVVQVGFDYGLFTGGAGFHAGAQACGATVVPLGDTDPSRAVQLMHSLGTTVLACTPSYALQLADAAADAGLSPSRDFKLRVGLHGAEPFSEALRSQLETIWGYKVLDIYGLTEVMGPGVAYETFERDGLHLVPGHFLAEIIDPESTKPVPAGQWGELVLTTLQREACPLIRYRTGDITRFLPDTAHAGKTGGAGSAGSAGSMDSAGSTEGAIGTVGTSAASCQRIDRIQGRTDDMLILGGINVFPSQLAQVLSSFEGVSNVHQLELDRRGGRDTATLKVEIDPGFVLDSVGAVERLQAGIAVGLKAELLTSIRVKLVEPRSIPRSAGKVQHVIDLRKDGAQ